MSYAIGQKVVLKNGLAGVIRFVGSTHFQPGEWIGIELDDPEGKNDGSVEGERYFECTKEGDLYGVFVRAALIVSNRTSEVESKLKGIIRVLEDKLQKLHQKINSLQQDVQTLQGSNSQLEKTIETLEQQLEHEAVEKGILEQQIEQLSALKEEYQQLQTRFNDTRASAGNTTHPKSSKIDHESQLLQQISSLEAQLSQIDEIQTRYDQCQIQMEALKRTNQQLQEHLENLEESESIIERLTSENMDHLNRIAVLETTISELEKLQELDGDLEKGHLEVENDLREEIVDLERNLKAKRDEVERLKATNKRLEEIITRLNREQHNEPKQEGDTETIIMNLKHENSHLKAIKAQLRLQTLLGEVERSAITEYTDFLAKLPPISPNMTDYFNFLKLSKLCLKFEAYFLEMSSKEVHSFEDYSVQLNYLENAYHLGCLEVETSYVSQLLMYSNEPSERLKEQAETYFSEFETRFERNDFVFHLDDDLSPNEYIQNREMLLKELNSHLKQTEYTVLLVGLIEKGMILLGIRKSLSEVFETFDQVKKGLANRISQLEEYRSKEMGIMDTKELDFSELKRVFEYVKELGLGLETANEASVKGFKIKLSSEQLLGAVEALKFEPIHAPANDSWSSKDNTEHTDTREASVPVIDNREDIISELTLKISILQTKLDKHKVDETTLLKAENELQETRRRNDELAQNLESVKMEQQETVEKLQKTEQKLRVYGGDSTGDIMEELQNIKKSQLVYEIAKLRDLITRITNKSATNRGIRGDLAWLEQDVGRRCDFEEYRRREYQLTEAARRILKSKPFRVISVSARGGRHTERYLDMMYGSIVG